MAIIYSQQLFAICLLFVASSKNSGSSAFSTNHLVGWATTTRLSISHRHGHPQKIRHHHHHPRSSTSSVTWSPIILNSISYPNNRQTSSVIREISSPSTKTLNDNVVGMKGPGVPLTSAIQRSNTRITPSTTSNDEYYYDYYYDRDDQVVTLKDDALKPVVVQGGSLRTWSFTSDKIQSVQVSLKTEGRPLKAGIDIWTGPDSTPQKIGVYTEDGDFRPFNAIIATPSSKGGQKHAIAVRNTANIEFPLKATVEVDSLFPSALYSGGGSSGNKMEDVAHRLFAVGKAKTIQGGAVRTIPFSPSVASIQLMLTTDGRPLNARIELLQGPNNVKQVMEVFTEDGMDRPFFAIVETPGAGNVVRIVNTGPMEFPINCRIEPYTVEDPQWDDYGYYGYGGTSSKNAARGWDESRNDLFFLNSR